MLEKIQAEGGPTRTMMGFMIDDPRAALQFEGTVLKNQKKIGRITCYTYGYTVEKVIGYCLIDTDAAKPGDVVSIHGYKATLADRVFYDPENTRIRG